MSQDFVASCGNAQTSVVPEQSHKREMEAAVRADFARLRQRGVSTTVDARPRAPALANDTAVEVDESLDSTPTEASPEPRRSLLDRMLGRP
jgi:hypothetical protein